MDVVCEQGQHLHEDFDQAIRLNPNDVAAFNSRCYGRASTGSLVEALADCNESLRLLPGNADILESRGFTYLKIRQSPQAIADYDAVLKVDPKQAFALFGRGVARHQVGDVSGGKADIAAATAINGTVAERLARRGAASFRERSAKRTFLGSARPSAPIMLPVSQEGGHPADSCPDPSEAVRVEEN